MLPKFQLIPVFAALLLGACHTKTNQKHPSDTTYQYRLFSRGGTGKIYKGREIAQVMDFEGAEWLERNSRPKEENTAKVISSLPLTDSSSVADIGAGTGYYTFKIAPKLIKGKVYAVEIQDDAVNFLKKRCKELKHDNVTVVKGTEKSPNLPDNSIDLAIMVDAYHELRYPHEIMQALRRSLKPHGKVLLVEYRAEDTSIPIKPLHKMSIQQANKEMAANGFHLVRDEEFLPIQHFLMYEKD
ncbi:class I SAM-dependent methyltransferase [Mucilaginibacter koreensis]